MCIPNISTQCSLLLVYPLESRHEMDATVDYPSFSNRLFRFVAGLMSRDCTVACAKYTLSFISLLCSVRSICSTFLVRSTLVDQAVCVCLPFTFIVPSVYVLHSFIYRVCSGFICVCIGTKLNGNFLWPLLNNNNTVVSQKFQHSRLTCSIPNFHKSRWILPRIIVFNKIGECVF